MALVDAQGMFHLVVKSQNSNEIKCQTPEFCFGTPKSHSLEKREMNAFIDYYKILQSERNASNEQLKRSYQRLVLLSHPDKAGDGQEMKFHLIQKAWSILKDPTSRRQYDAEFACYENDQLLLYNTISISEMRFDAAEDAYTYPCRCNGVYYLEAGELSSNKVIIGCNECSFSIQVNIAR
ncbi:jg8445 [Pararge aegeria aegeria]|uniref:Jg8445 protein n=2 Tax=Pararge aegeria TaxID=116150 RepID=A0A8S4S4V3_9NEOP|nr:jg8445 [Pararge aegeria aegeria]